MWCDHMLLNMVTLNKELWIQDCSMWILLEENKRMEAVDEMTDECNCFITI